MTQQTKRLTFYRDGREFEVVKLHHLTRANSTRRARSGKEWATVATVRDTYNGAEATAYSWCSRKDRPCRRVGREIAIGRAVATLSPLK